MRQKEDGKKVGTEDRKALIKRLQTHFSENKLAYEPPYDSPIEDTFAWNLSKYMDSNLKLDKQVDVSTPWGNFILDFVVECKSERIAFECDGKDFHDVGRDEWRDAMILGEGYIDTIYRLRGTDLVYHTEDCLFVISRLEPQIFSTQGRLDLEMLVSNPIKEKLDFILDGGPIIRLDYPLEPGRFDPLFIFIVKETRHIPAGKRAFWEVLYSYALKNRGLALDELIEKHHKELDVELEEGGIELEKGGIIDNMEGIADMLSSADRAYDNETSQASDDLIKAIAHFNLHTARHT